MPVFDVSGNLKVVGDRAGNIMVLEPTGSIVASAANYLFFSGSGVAGVTAVNSGVLINLQGSGGGGGEGGGTGSYVLAAASPLTIFPVASVSLWLKSDRGLVYGAYPSVTGWADNTTYENDALQTNSSIQPTLYTGSVNFNGTSQYMEISDSGASELLPTANMLLGFRVRPDTLASSRAWLTKGTTGGVGNWSIQYSGEFRFFAGAVGSLNYGIVNSSYFTAGAWHTVLISYNGAGSDNLSRLRMWVNGARVSCSYNGTIPATLPGTAGTPITIGCFNGPVQYFQGAYQQIVMVNLVPTDDQIIQINNYLTSGTIDANTNSGFVVNETPTPRIRTTASLAIGSTTQFAEDIGSNINFYVSGTITTGSSDKLAVFGGSLVTSGNIYIRSTEASQSYLSMTGSEVPGIPAPGSLRLFATSRAKRLIPSFIGPSGLDVLVQPALFGNAMMILGPNTTTTLTAWGGNFTTSGTVAHPTPIYNTVSGIMGTVKNARFTPAAAIGNGAGFRTTDTVAWRGAYTGSGGWFSALRFSVFINNPSRCFAGFNSAASFNGHTTDISASTNFIGIGWDRNDPLTGTWRVMRRDGSTYVTEEIPNMIRTSTTGSLIDLFTFAPPHGTYINLQVIEHISLSNHGGVVSLPRWSQTYTSSIPTKTTFLRFCMGIFNQTGSKASNIFLNRFYLETDF